MVLSDTLNNIEYTVTHLSHKGNELRRILDMGIIDGAKIMRLFSSPFGDPTAFLISDTVIALRQADCDKILVDYKGGTQYED